MLKYIFEFWERFEGNIIACIGLLSDYKHIDGTLYKVGIDGASHLWI